MNTIPDSMTVDERIAALAALGAWLMEEDPRMEAHIHRASVGNPWFTKDDIHYAIGHIAGAFLDSGRLMEWVKQYRIGGDAAKIGLVMAGNIPLVGFHDFLCAFVAGHISRIKLSEQDKYLMPFLLQRLTEIDKQTSRYFSFVDTLRDFDAVIATGSNNTARYFEYYFGKYPNIIRKNKNAVAVLTGRETTEQLTLLGDDVFRYFGLGCRSVSHLYIPEGYDLAPLGEAFDAFRDVGQHPKYKNNLDYNRAIYIINKEPHINLPNIVLMERDDLISPIGCLYFTRYSGLAQVSAELKRRQQDIQVVVSAEVLDHVHTVPLGEAQRPGLSDYADDIDTLEFLTQLPVA